MCKVGDIILVQNYNDNGIDLSRHSFVIISDEAGQIQGLEYDLMCNVMSSFKNVKHREQKLKYSGNYEVLYTDSIITDGGNGLDGYIKAEQFYYFTKDTIEYEVIGSLEPEFFDSLIQFIEDLEIQTIDVLDNIKKND